MKAGGKEYDLTGVIEAQAAAAAEAAAEAERFFETGTEVWHHPPAPASLLRAGWREDWRSREA